MKNKLLSVLLTVAMLLTLMPAVAFATDPQYGITVTKIAGGEVVPAEVGADYRIPDGADCYYDGKYLYIANDDLTISGTGVDTKCIFIWPDVETVTFNDLNIEDYIRIRSSDTGAEKSLTIILKGDNQIGESVEYNHDITEESYSSSKSLDFERDLQITGDGTLKIFDAFEGICGTAHITFMDSFSGTLTVEDAGFDIQSEPKPPCAISINDKKLTINGGTLNLTSYNKNAITAGEIVVSGGSLTAKGGSQAMSVAPTLGSGVAVLSASENFDGSSPVSTYDPISINTYKCIEIGTQDVPVIHEHDGITFEAWGDGVSLTTSLPDSEGSYYLTTDVAISETWNVPQGTTNLCMNGHVINATSTGAFSAITVDSGATLNLYDCGDTVHYYEYSTSDAWTWNDNAAGKDSAITVELMDEYTEDGAVVMVFGGVITGGSGNTNDGITFGGGVYVAGTFNMYGTSIVGNKTMKSDGSAGGCGGGVYVNEGAVFTMNGECLITGNNSYNGAVYAKGLFAMSENSVIAFSKGGSVGAVLVDAGSFAMSGESRISYNEGTVFGGGVEVTNDGTFTMSENSVIEHNKGKKAGGVYVVKGAFNMTGGSINNNTTTDNGGGVYVDTNATVTLGGTAQIIDNNKVSSPGTEDETWTASNLYLSDGKTVAFSSEATPTDLYVGVTTKTEPADCAPVVLVERNAKRSNAKSFISDLGYSVVLSGSALYLEYSYPVKVGGIQVTPGNKDDVLGEADGDAKSVSYDPETHTLTLNNAEIATDGNRCASAILCDLPDYLNIELIGENRIGAVPEDAENKGDYNVLCGISCSDIEVAITGDGNLTMYTWLDGIWADNVNISPDFTGILTINNYGEINTITGTEYFSDMPAIRADSNVGVRGGTLNVTCRDGGGIYASEGNIVIEGGATVNITTDKFSGIKAAPGMMGEDEVIGSFYAGGGDVYIYNGAKVTVNAATKVNELITDVYGICAAGSVKIGKEDEIYEYPTEQPPIPDSEEVSITVGNANCTGEFDINGIHSENGDTSVIGSKVVITAVKGRGISTDNNILITDSTLDIDAGSSGMVAFKDGSECDVTITNSTVSVKAENWGIDALNDMTITDSTVNVESDTWGIECDTLTVDGIETQICSAGGEIGLTVFGGANALTVKNGSLKLVGGKMAFDAGENAAFTMSLPEGYELIGSRAENVFTNLQSVTLKKYSGADEFYSNHTVSYVDSAEAKSVMLAEKSSGSGDSGDAENYTPIITVPVSGNENTVKVSATVRGNTATVKKIADADIEKVTEGESVSIDLSNAGKKVDTAKIPTETVEKIAEKSAMTVKLPVATVEFDKAATEEIADQAKGSNIELVVDDIKEVSLNAVQKESVKKLDTAIIIDAHLASNGSKLCTADNGGFGGGSAKVILPYEIKNNRKPENYSVFYVNEAGKLEKLNAVYDEELKAFVFEIEHFSVYAVAFEQFVDIDANAYYYDAVKWAVANGVTDGVDATHFNPSGITNRAQMVTFLWKAAGKPEPTITETPFTDLDPDWYYYKAVLWAYENGITDGTSATTFEPNKNVSRAQVVTFLWRYAGKPYVDYFMNMSDVASGMYYTEAVRWALAEKITEGTTTTTFSPNDDCLRGQIVTFLYRDFAK